MMVTTIWRLEGARFGFADAVGSSFYQFLGVPGVMQKDGAANLKSSPTFFLMVIKLKLQSRPSFFDGDCDSFFD